VIAYVTVTASSDGADSTTRIGTTLEASSAKLVVLANPAVIGGGPSGPPSAGSAPGLKLQAAPTTAPRATSAATAIPRIGVIVTQRPGDGSGSHHIDKCP
jgi:hypothetical protein